MTRSRFGRRDVPGTLLVGSLVLLATLGCSEDVVAPVTEEGVLVATILRKEVTDSSSYFAELRSAPRPERGESGDWDVEYADVSRYAISGEAWFTNRTNGAPVPVLLRTDGSFPSGSVVVVVDRAVASVSILGLRRLDVWFRLDVFRIDGS